MISNTSFSGCEIQNGLLFDLSRDQFPCKVYGFDSGEYVETCDQHTTFGYISEGVGQLIRQGNTYPICPGMYFSVPGKFKLSGGKGFVIQYQHYHGFFNLGGPVETSGRLKYIDGCTDSLIIQPIRKGDPCLNTLFFPANTMQTQHTHPSYRVGMVLDGRGLCVTPEGDIPLIAGHVFIILTNGVHSFATGKQEGMSVFSFHPDSDFGPEDENHPMINRTIVQGQSASLIPELFTK